MARNLLAGGYDFIGALTRAADDGALRDSINGYTIEELKPVLKVHGVKNISKMKKADIVEAIVELVHARQSEQAVSEPVTEPEAEATLETLELAAEPEIGGIL